MSLRLATKRRRLAAAAVLVLATFGAAGLARAVTTPTNCKGCFAMVRANGSLVYYRGVKTNYKPNTAQFIIDFKYPINKCALTATADTLESGVATNPATIVLARNSSIRVTILRLITKAHPLTAPSAWS